MSWEPVQEWVAEQPLRCTVCGDVLTGRDLGYLPVFCLEQNCPGPTDRRDPVRVVRAPDLDQAAGGEQHDARHDRQADHGS